MAPLNTTWAETSKARAVVTGWSRPGTRPGPGRRGHQVGDGAVEADLALLHEQGPVGQRLGHVQRLLDDDHGLALVLQRPHRDQQLLDHDRGQAEGQLVDDEHFGLVDQRHGQGQHLLLAAGEVAGPGVVPLGQHREPGQRRLDPGVEVGAPVQVPGHPQVLAHAERGEGGPAPHELDDADLHPDLGIGVGDRAPVEPHHAPEGHAQPADDPQQRGLAGTVGAEQGHRLAPVDVEGHVVEHLHRAVGEVQVAHLDHRHLALSPVAASELLLLLLELLDAAGDVAPDVAAAVGHQRPADQAGRQDHGDDRGLAADGVAEDAGQHRTEEPAEAEQVDADHGGAPGPEPVGQDRRRRGEDDRERGPGHRDADGQHDPDQDHVGHQQGEGHEGPEAGDQTAHEHHRAGRTGPEEAVAVPARDRDRDDGGEVGGRREQAPFEGVEAELLLQEQVEEQREAEQGQAEAGHAQQEEVEGLDRPQALEGDAERDRELVPVVELLAQNGLHLVTAPAGLGETGQREGQGHGQHRDEEEGPPPRLRPADQLGDAAGQQGGDDEPAELEREGQAEDSTPGLDRVRVDEDRSVHRQLVGLGQPGPDPGHEQREGVLDHAGEGDQDRPEGDAHRGDPGPGQAVGEAADGHRPDQEQDTSGAGDRAHHRIAGAERLLDVRAEHRQGDVVEADERPGQPDGDDGRPAPDLQRFAQRHLLAADPGQEVVGQDDGWGRGAGRGATGLLLQDGGCQPPVLPLPAGHAPGPVRPAPRSVPRRRRAGTRPPLS